MVLNFEFCVFISIFGMQTTKTLKTTNICSVKIKFRRLKTTKTMLSNLLMTMTIAVLPILKCMAMSLCNVVPNSSFLSKLMMLLSISSLVIVFFIVLIPFIFKHFLFSFGEVFFLFSSPFLCLYYTLRPLNVADYNVS